MLWLFMFTLACLCGLRVGEMWLLDKEYIYVNRDTNTYIIKWPKGMVKAGRIRHLPSYCNAVVEVFVAMKYNMLQKYEKGMVARWIKGKLHCTLASCRHVGANLVLEHWQSLNGVARTLGHKSESTSLFYLDAWQHKVEPSELASVAAREMRARFSK